MLTCLAPGPPRPSGSDFWGQGGPLRNLPHKQTSPCHSDPCLCPKSIEHTISRNYELRVHKGFWKRHDLEKPRAETTVPGSRRLTQQEARSVSSAWKLSGRSQDLPQEAGVSQGREWPQPGSTGPEEPGKRTPVNADATVPSTAAGRALPAACPTESEPPGASSLPPQRWAQLTGPQQAPQAGTFVLVVCACEGPGQGPRDPKGPPLPSVPPREEMHRAPHVG